MTTNGTPFYPVFRPNQVLTDNHLNDAVSYLEAQTRLTRAALIGTGIICGFEPSRDGAKIALALTGGCGITTEGYLVVSDACTLTHYRLAALEKDDLPGLDGVFSPVIHELFTSATPKGVREDLENPIVALNESQDDAGTALWPVLSGKVVVLLLHIEDEERDICLFDCDEAGARRSFHVRKLVMDPADAEAILRAGYGLPDGTDLDRVFNRSYYLPDLTLKRFGYVQKGDDGQDASEIDLQSITSLSAYLEAYDRVCGEDTRGGGKNPLFEAIAEAYQRADELFSPFFAGSPPDSDRDFAELAETLMTFFQEVRDRGVQYFYDYLKDLILAYDELKAAAFDLMDDCLPPSGRYPRHLMLGTVVPSASCPPSVLRTPFTQPPIYNGNARRVQAVRSLYDRMRRLAQAFDVPAADADQQSAIKITPSRLAPAPLGTRAIPFYYQPKDEVHRAWDFERSRRCKAEQNHSYHPLTDDQTGAVEDPLLCDIDAYDFYRIEGHVGHTYEDALRKVQVLRAQYNLAFDVVALKISLVADLDNVQYNFVFEDLEAAYSKCKEELLCVLAELVDPNLEPPQDVSAAMVSLTTGLTTAPNVPDDDTPQDEFLFGDYYNLTRLSQDTHFSDFEGLHTTVFTWVREENLPFIDCCPETARLLLDAYSERVSEIQQQLLFHVYAQRHPGVEHLAGVPRGGTFILAYINEGEEALIQEVQRQALEQAGDANAKERALLLGETTDEIQKALIQIREASRQGIDAFTSRSEEAIKDLEEARAALAKVQGSEDAVASIEELLAAELAARANTVVGDFCLPYRCCGDAPGFTFVVAQPRPIVLLEEVSYCPNDPGPYDFVLHPPNGFLDGPGVDSSSGIYQFIPNHPEVQALLGDGPTLVTFTYTADGGSDTLTVEILPLRDAGFTNVPEFVCIVSGDPAHPANQRIELVPTTPGGTFTPAGTPLETEGGNVFFNPMTATPGQPVDITYTVPDGDDGCANSETQTVTVVETPDAGFTFGPEDQTAFCTTDDPVTLIANAPEFSSGFFGEGVGANDIFDPSLVDVIGGEEPASVKIIHDVINEDTGCGNTLVRTVTVSALPDASFTGPGADLFCVNLEIPEDPSVSPAPQALVPTVVGGTFRLRYTIAGQEATVEFKDANAEAITSLIIGIAQELTPEEDSVLVTLDHTVGPEGCSGTAETTFTVALQPEASFTGPGDGFCVVLSGSDTFSVTPAPQALVPTPGGGQFTLNYSLGGDTRTEVLDAFDAAAMANTIDEIAQNMLDAQQDNVDVALTYTVNVGGAEGCSGTHTETFSVTRQPEPRFDPGSPTLTPEGDAFTVAITGFQPDAFDSVDFTWTSDVEPNSRVANFDGQQLLFTLAEVGEATTLSITLVVTRGSCTSDSVTEDVQVPQEPGATFVPPDLGSDTLAVLDERTLERQDTLTTLAEENAAFSDTLSFSRTSDFVQLPPETPTSDVVAQYDSVIKTVVPSLRGATDPQRQAAFAQLVEIATHSLFDKLTLGEPTAAEEAVIASQIENIKSDIDFDALRVNWRGDDLKSVLPEDNVDGSIARLG